MVPDELPSGSVAKAVHYGSHDQIVETWALLRAWVKMENLVEAGVPWETYPTNPREQTDPKDQRNELYLPVREHSTDIHRRQDE